MLDAQAVARWFSGHVHATRLTKCHVWWMRLPLHPFVAGALANYGIVPSQLARSHHLRRALPLPQRSSAAAVARRDRALLACGGAVPLHTAHVGVSCQPPRQLRRPSAVGMGLPLHPFVAGALAHYALLNCSTFSLVLIGSAPIKNLILPFPLFMPDFLSFS
jgi:hypothetical protein